MTDRNFSNWTKWTDRNSLVGIEYPGIYCLAISEEELSQLSFSWVPEIKYIGMTNSIKGLKGRLKQFDNTIIGKRGHGGADRFRYRYQNYQELASKLYVSVFSFKCNVQSNSPEDLRLMGKVTEFEFECLAKYVENFGKLPEFNNKEASPKYSLTH